MPFESFVWFSHHGLRAIIQWSTNTCMISMWLFEEFWFLFWFSFFNILGALKKKTIIPLMLVGCEIIIADSYPTRAHPDVELNWTTLNFTCSSNGTYCQFFHLCSLYNENKNNHNNTRIHAINIKLSDRFCYICSVKNYVWMEKNHFKCGRANIQIMEDNNYTRRSHSKVNGETKS